ncbi:hypothetical protein DXG03_007713 [Asterophora parasitica]|uniref:Uncharacterized protein n=1 Tax=Asterophora parasitica TaxID=117018 RepID=A0A9P7K6W9_9AGAR|nr:hypothetical protein DXG03_007713 [Asterophora parasitica]
MPKQSLQLKVELKTTNMQEVLSVQPLVDSGATSYFLDSSFVEHHWLTIHPLYQVILVYNVNSTANKAGTVKNVVKAYNGYTKRALFAVTSLGKQDMILGYTWLKEHNPEID